MRKWNKSKAFEQLFENLPLAIRVLGIDGTTKRVNTAFEKLSGIDKEKCVGRTCSQLFPGNMCTTHQCCVKQIQQGKTITSVEDIRKSKNDRKICYVTALPVKKEDGTIDEIIECFQDITEKKYKEEELRQNIRLEQLLSAISLVSMSLEPSEIATWIKAGMHNIGVLIGADSGCLFYFNTDSKNIEQSFHWEDTELIAKPEKRDKYSFSSMTWIMDQLSRNEPVIIQRLQDFPQKAIKERKYFTSKKVKSVILLPLNHRNVFRGFLCFTTVKVEQLWSRKDVSLLEILAQMFVNVLQSQRSDRLLRESELKFRTLFEDSSDVIFITSRDGKLVDINRAGQELFGISKHEFRNFSMADLCRNSSDWINYQKTIEENGSTHDLELEMVDKTRRTIHALITTTAWKEDNGEIRGYQSILHDVTLQKNTEKKLKQSLINSQKTIDDVIFAMSSMVQVRDPYTASHQLRVAQLAVAISRKMGFPESTVKGIKAAGILHDIGKIYVPSEFLNKPGKISNLEFNIIKTHPQVGFDILRTIDFPWSIAEWVLQHHERLDGTGYPKGLHSGEIQLEALILSVADVTEAMASHRPYRPARGLHSALEEISTGKGIRYHPEVVDACLALFEEGDFEYTENIDAIDFVSVANATH
ncbi:PAS domain S-box protein [bacterium]|nr:PAS domain S-box protein [bacterium]